MPDVLRRPRLIEARLRRPGSAGAVCG